jgi:hypothetical protein
MTARWCTRAVGAGMLAGAAVLVGACGSAGSPDAAATVSRTCQAVAAVLSDGPNPTADPVGYAEAQVRPLRAVRTSDPVLRDDIQRLDRAYAELFDSNGSPSATHAVAKASARLDAVCPKAAP